MKLFRLLPAVALVAACSSADSPATSLPLSPLQDVSETAASGQVYTQSNSASGNEVLLFNRAADGSLTAGGAYWTGGNGTGAGLGNQSSLALTSNGRFLLTINAGSDEVSSFAVRRNGTLDLIGAYPSGGSMPLSVTISGSTVYVVNGGGSGNISGFTLSSRGVLAPIAGSTLPLSSSASGPAQIAFSPNGRVLVVTEKATNSLSVYRVAANGSATGPTVVPSNGATPFGFAFHGPVLVVSEAFGGAADASAASSYELHANGSLETITASAPTTETAACWVAFSIDGRFAYTANTGSGTITGYSVHNGALTLLNADGVTGVFGAGSSPIDLAVSPDGGYLYALGSGAHAIAVFAINADGSLTSAMGGASGLAPGTNGLLSR
ncbi:MAG: beta-propeller fold lactonase family protein [Gemmatimonadota bacterium]